MVACVRNTLEVGRIASPGPTDRGPGVGIHHRWDTVIFEISFNSVLTLFPSRGPTSGALVLIRIYFRQPCMGVPRYGSDMLVRSHGTVNNANIQKNVTYKLYRNSFYN